MFFHFRVLPFVSFYLLQIINYKSVKMCSIFIKFVKNDNDNLVYNEDKVKILCAVKG